MCRSGLPVLDHHKNKSGHEGDGCFDKAVRHLEINTPKTYMVTTSHP
jgi:hypothetical protein